VHLNEAGTSDVHGEGDGGFKGAHSTMLGFDTRARQD
jgi:hypothetical protein